MILFHVDACKISHVESKVLDNTNMATVKDGNGEMKVHEGLVNKYLGMTLDFSTKPQAMTNYVNKKRGACLRRRFTCHATKQVQL